MKRNIGNLDKFLRIFFAALFVALYLTGVVKGPIGIIMLLIALMFVVTAVFGICPLYSVFGWTTRKKVSS
jgi:hypothetical protein